MKKLSAGAGLVLLAVALSVSAGGLVWAQATDKGGPTTAAAPAGDAVGHFRKAKDLFDAGKYPEAKVEVEAALAADPKLSDAVLLMVRVDAELAKHPATGGGAATTAAAPKDSLLTQEQVSRVRFFELTSKDTTIQGAISQKDLRDFWNEVAVKEPGADPSRAAMDAFLAASLRAQVERIKDSPLPGAAAFIDRVKITSDPAGMIAFRKTVQPYLINNCVACHSGANANGYRIYGRVGMAPSDRETYTNYYMLATYIKDGKQMLNRDDAEQSLLVQYSLVRTGATTPHPGTVEVTNKLSGPADARYKDMVEWIKGLAFPKPVYGISYTPAVTTAPATQK